MTCTAYLASPRHSLANKARQIEYQPSSHSYLPLNCQVGRLSALNSDKSRQDSRLREPASNLYLRCVCGECPACLRRVPSERALLRGCARRFMP